MHKQTNNATRWGKRTRADSESAREQILDAALGCYQSEGIIKTTVEHVAREAKVSRTTVYRYFKNRDEILTGVVLREAMIVLDAMQQSMQGIDDLADYLVEGMVFILQMAPRMPLYRFGFGAEGAALTSRLCFTSEELLALGRALVGPKYENALAKADVPEAMQLDHIIEWVTRILLSYLTTSSTMERSELELRALFSTFLKPAFNQKSLPAGSV
jgi:AcrR family transcriptional regulator